jgi:hypothetical protein
VAGLELGPGSQRKKEDAGMARRQGAGGFVVAWVFAAGLASGAIGCGAGADVPQKRERTASVQQAFTPPSGSQPNCNDSRTPTTVVMAIPHAGCIGGAGADCYWGPAPTPGVADPTEQKYERNLWSYVYQSNGYEYLLQIVSTTEPPDEGPNGERKFFPSTGHLFFGVGIEYEPQSGLPANPPYYMQPPVPPVYPTFNPNVYFGPDTSDWNNEVTFATGPTWAGPSGGANPPVNSEFWRCVTVLDQAGNQIDYFVLMDEHDPTPGHPW